MDSQERTTNTNSSNSRQNADSSFLTPLEPWIKSIRDIYKIRRCGRLVVFVGSGVSNNSNLPTWWGLIKDMADELQLPLKELASGGYALAPDDYLKIAQYYFDSFGEEKYFAKIQGLYGGEHPSNPIDDIIFKLNPRHIVTTNYDPLLENSAENRQKDSTRKYCVVADDHDLVSLPERLNSFGYVIKMHGDIKKRDTIILKEKDYLDYELTHPVMCAFLKALLIDHTFLFIGYSLDDYNVKLIIEWMHYISKGYGKHYFIRTILGESKDQENEALNDNRSNPLEKPDASADDVKTKDQSAALPNSGGRTNIKHELEQKRLQNYGIEVVNLTENQIGKLEIPEKERSEGYKKYFCKNDGLSPGKLDGQKHGRLLYLCLYHLSDYDKFMLRYCVQDYIKDRILVLNEFEQISVRDASRLFAFHNVQIKVASKIEERKRRVSFEISSSPQEPGIQQNCLDIQRDFLLQLEGYLCQTGSSELSLFFQKTGVCNISLTNDKDVVSSRSQFKYYSLYKDANPRNEDRLFDKYLENDYIGISKELDSNEKKYSSESELFYRLLLGDPSRFNPSYFDKKEKNEEKRPKERSRVYFEQEALLRKLLIQIRKCEFYKQLQDRQRTTTEESVLFQYLNSLDVNVASVVRYYYGNIIQSNSLSSREKERENSIELEIATFVYDFYFFIFQNHLPLLDCERLEVLFYPFIKWKFNEGCVPSGKKIEENEPIRYELNEIDFDIVVKYSNTKKLKKLFHKNLRNNNEILVKFEETKLSNLCNSISELGKPYLWNYLIRFMMVLSYVKYEQSDKKIIVKMIDSIHSTCKKSKQDVCFEERFQLSQILENFFAKNTIDTDKTQEILKALRTSPTIDSPFNATSEQNYTPFL